MGTELTGPIEIRNAKGVFPPDELWNTATEYSFEAVYENGVTMIVSNKEKMGVTFEGTKGKIYVDRGKLEADPKSLLDSKIGPDGIHLYKSDDHFRNFIDCVISREPTAAPVEVAHRSITICHLGNIAMRLNREKLRWDPRTEQIIGDDEAARMLSRPYRAPWALPGDLMRRLPGRVRSSPSLARAVMVEQAAGLSWGPFWPRQSQSARNDARPKARANGHSRARGSHLALRVSRSTHFDYH